MKNQVEPILGDVTVPASVSDLESFRMWGDTLDFPEWGRIEFYDGHVHIDLTHNDLFIHCSLNGELIRVLVGLANEEDVGRYWSRGATVVNVRAGYSTVPDGVFVSHAGLKSLRSQFVRGPTGAFNEILGSPDALIEIVSDSSFVRDTQRMKELNAIAQVSEYWLFDARGDTPQFDIFRLADGGYLPTRKQAGWLRSAVFGKSFRLTRSVASDGYPEFTLDVK